MSNISLGVRAAAAGFASIAMLPTLTFAQSYSYPMYQNYPSQSYYTPSYLYDTMYPSSYSYAMPSIYISTGGDVYGGDYIPSINGSFSNSGGYGSYGYIPTMGMYNPSYSYPRYGGAVNYPYGYTGSYPNQYGYAAYPNYYGNYGYTGNPTYYNNPSYYGGSSGCNAAIGGVCGQDMSVGLGAALYHTVLPYNYTTGL